MINARAVRSVRLLIAVLLVAAIAGVACREEHSTASRAKGSGEFTLPLFQLLQGSWQLEMRGRSTVASGHSEFRKVRGVPVLIEDAQLGDSRFRTIFFEDVDKRKLYYVRLGSTTDLDETLSTVPDEGRGWLEFTRESGGGLTSFVEQDGLKIVIRDVQSGRETTSLTYRRK